jgi:hypothetical protein
VRPAERTSCCWRARGARCGSTANAAAASIFAARRVQFALRLPN